MKWLIWSIVLLSVGTLSGITSGLLPAPQYLAKAILYFIQIACLLGQFYCLYKAFKELRNVRD